AVPAHPQQTRSHHAKHHAVRRHDFFSKSEPVPEKHAKDQRRPPGGPVSNPSTSKIDRSDLRGRVPNSVHPAIDSPDHVRDWKIAGKHPDSDKNKHSREFHPLRNRADD